MIGLPLALAKARLLESEYRATNRPAEADAVRDATAIFAALDPAAEDGAPATIYNFFPVRQHARKPQPGTVHHLNDHHMAEEVVRG